MLPTVQKMVRQMILKRVVVRQLLTKEVAAEEILTEKTVRVIPISKETQTSNKVVALKVVKMQIMVI